MWLGSVDSAGVLQCTTDPVAADSYFVGGIAISAAGEAHITETPSDIFVNGFMVSATGQLVVEIDGVVAGSHLGIPRTAGGAVVAISSTPADTDPFVGGLRVANSGLFIFGGAVVWTPAALFASGEQGVWYDPSDLTTMFQDSAGTTPVTAVGQPVGKILDKSGNGNHATQATTASRPLLQQDGSGNYYLKFDGVDDYLITSSITASGQNCMLCAGFSETSSSYAPIFEYGQRYVDAGAIALWAGFGVAGITSSIGNGGDKYLVQGSPQSSSLQVLLSTFDLSYSGSGPGGIVLKKNGSTESLTYNGTAVSGSLVTSEATIFVRRYDSVFYNYVAGKLYSLIMRQSAMTPTEITDTETYVNSKTGAY